MSTMRPLNLKRDRKGQILSSEFIIASSIFLLVMASVLFMWVNLTGEINRSNKIYDLDESATLVVEKLSRTSGYPRNWDAYGADEINSLGLVNESRILDRGKISRFVKIMNSTTPGTDIFDNPCLNDPSVPGFTPYDCNRHLLGIGGYDFYFNIKHLNGSFVYLDGRPCVAGSTDFGEDYRIGKVRNALLDDEIVTIRIVLWD